MKKSLLMQTAAAAVTAATIMSAGSISAAAKAVPDTGIVSPMYIGISATDNDLKLGSYGKLSCYGYTEVSSGYYAGVTVELQKNDGGWTTLKTWSATGSLSATVEEDYFVVSGYSYRLKLTHKSYNKSWSEIESVTKYSTTVTY